MPAGNAYIEWWVHCDVPTYRQIEISTDAVTWQACVVSGWLPFRDYLDALAAAINAFAAGTWTVTLIDGGDETSRVRIRRTAGTEDLIFRFESQAMASLLGFSDTLTGAPGSAATGQAAPDGYLDCFAVAWENPRNAADSELVEMRHGRTFNPQWNTGTLYDLDVGLPWGRMDRLEAGPCRRGKVRVGDAVYSSGPMDPDDTAGYLDGYLVDVRPAPDDAYEQDAKLRAVLLLPDAEDRDTTSEELGDVVLGSLKRGFGWVYWADIEGLPVILEEHTTGQSLAGYTTAPRLVIDGSSSIGWQVDRSKGVVACRPLAMGIHDPENALGWWRRPRAGGAPVYTLASDVGATDTEIEVLEDLTSVGAGAGWLGKEYCTWSGVDTTGSPHKLTGVSRGTWGPRYTYRSGSIAQFRQISQRPAFWPGRIVRLWVSLVRPDGTAVGSTFGDDYSLQLYLGEIEKVPAYDRGTFNLRVLSLERRLTKPVGVPYQATLDGRRGDAPGDVYVWVAPGETFGLSFTASGTPATFAPQPINDPGNVRLALEIATHNVINTARAFIESGPSDVVNALAVSEFEDLQDGSVRVTVHCETNSLGSLDLWIYRTNDSPGWLTGLNIAQGPSLTHDYSWIVHPQSSPYFFVREPLSQQFGSAGLPTEGLAVVDGDPKEAVRYKGKYEVPGALGELWRLTIVDRGVGGSPRTDLTQKGTAVRGSILLQGKPGKILARLIESSGTGLRGTYDVLPEGAGYGLDDAYVDEASLTNLHSPAGSLSIVPEQRYSVEKLLGGLLAASWRAIGPVRVGRALKIGLLTTVPVEGLTDVSLDDAALLLRNAAEGEETMPGPSSVLIKGAQGALEQSKPNEFRATEQALESAKGAEEWELALWGLTPNMFFAVAPSMGVSLLSLTAQFSAVRLRCTPWRDLLPGLNAAINVTHPSLWDWEGGAMGLEGFGRVMSVERNLRTGAVTSNVLTGGQSRLGSLCPGFRVSGKAGLEITFAEDVSKFFVGGETMRFVNPGRSTEITDLDLASVAGTTVVVTTTPPAWIAAGVTVGTYPQEGSGSARQDAFVHHDDESTWEF